MKCPNCGKEIANDSQFCEFCGAKINLITIEEKRPKNYKPLWVSLIVIICASAFGIVAYNQYENVQSERAEAQLRISALEQQTEELQKQEKRRKDEELRLEKERKRHEDDVWIAKRKELLAQGYVDLGLPSGTWWKKTSEKEMLTYGDAVKQYGEKIPTLEQWQEIIKFCKWVWVDEGQWFEQGGERYKISGDCWYKIIGLNGNSIKMIADGYVDAEDNLCVGCGGVGGVGGYYLSYIGNSNSLWYCGFDDSDVRCYKWPDYFNGKYELSVHLVQGF